MKHKGRRYLMGCGERLDSRLGLPRWQAGRRIGAMASAKPIAPPAELFATIAGRGKSGK